MHFHLSQGVENGRHVFQLRPVELNVLPRCPVAIALVIFLGDHGKLLELPGIQRAIGNGHPQHIGMKLQIEPVHQAQRLELIFSDFAFNAPLHLIAELGCARLHKVIVKFVVAIHEIRVRLKNERGEKRQLICQFCTVGS